jgi:hypothetical protein
LLNERARDWDNIPLDLIEKAKIVLTAERQARQEKIKNHTLMPVTNYDLIN